MERGSSVVERRTRNQVSPGFESPLWYRFKDLAFSFSSLTPLLTQLYLYINEYLAIDSGGNVSGLVLARNCCLARMLPGEAELVAERMGLSGRAKSVKLFEQTNGLDNALYKNYLFFSWPCHIMWMMSVGSRRRDMPNGYNQNMALVLLLLLLHRVLDILISVATSV